MRVRAGPGSPAKPAPPASPGIGSGGCSLGVSGGPCPDTPEALSHETLTPEALAHETLAHEALAPGALTHEEPPSDSTDGLLGDPEYLAGPADSSRCSWEQTVPYFMAMSLDDSFDSVNRSYSTAHPDAQLQTEGAKDSGDYIEEIAAQLKEVDFTIESVHSDYSGYESLLIDRGEFTHVIEIYDFPAAFRTDDLLDAFAEFSEGGLKIKWVDNTHALGVFSSESAALQALSLQHPLVKVRSLYEGSKKSKGKALRRAEFIQPVKERPRTDTAAARRMVTRALGLPKPGPCGKRC